MSLQQAARAEPRRRRQSSVSQSVPQAPAEHGTNPQPVCPHCGSRRVQRYGFFRWKDGTRRQRHLCIACSRTFNPHTGTPMHCLKKRDQWARQAPGLGEARSLRCMARELGIRVPTAFRWRHLLLAALHSRPQPCFTGRVAMTETYIPYSDKGSRITRGPGSWGARRPPLHRGRLGNLGQGGPNRFRLFADGKPSCVLLACDEKQRAAVVIGQGRPKPMMLEQHLSRLVRPGAQVWAYTSNHDYAAVCRQLDVTHTAAWRADPTTTAVQLYHVPDLFLTQLRPWIRRFHGVATKYLAHYLVWYRSLCLDGRLSPDAVGRQMLSLAMEPRSQPAPSLLGPLRA